MVLVLTTFFVQFGKIFPHTSFFLVPGRLFPPHSIPTKRGIYGTLVWHTTLLKWFAIFLQVVYLAGVVLNEGINFVLKHILQDPRPATGRVYRGVEGGQWVGPQSQDISLGNMHKPCHMRVLLELRP